MAARGVTEILVHGTAIALGDRAALLRGASGSGKSDLALRAISMPVSQFGGALFELVADDQVLVGMDDSGLTVLPPPEVAGLIEVRGIGVIRVHHRVKARLDLFVDLVDRQNVERLPDPWPDDSLLGVRLPVLKLAPFEASAPLKLAVALSQQPWLGLGD